MVGKNLAQQLEDATTERVPRLRLSAIGKPSRQLYYELNYAPKESLTGDTLFKFQYGHILEEMVLYLAKEAGHEVLYEQKEVTIGGIKGHIDAYIDGVLVDVKSASPFGFLKFKNGTIRQNDGFNYIPQLAAYSQSEGNPDGAFLAINKINGEMCLCKFPSEELAAVDIQGHIARQKRVQDNPHRVPERCFDTVPEGKSGNMRLGTNCGYCPFKQHCWRDANGGKGLRAFAYSNKVTFLTKVAKQPRVFEVEMKKPKERVKPSV